MRVAGKDAAMLLYSQGSDQFLEDLARNADRMWYFDEVPKESPRLVAKSSLKPRS